ncbi:MAG: DJ-1/PfpI family protein [Treponema sp.]|jgi:4-methyl-5(b-hydroxyethyl)-thiazole monophosphate biosynthesis|nr:DJ-1/PfpI family protein [Treponema sp.]
MAKKVVVFLAEGFEEVEAITPIDYLRRAGLEVCIVSISAETAVKGAKDVTILANTNIKALEETGHLTAANWDAVVLPGGMPGAANLAACAPLSAFLKEMEAGGKWIAAICAAPAVALAPLGILNGKSFTCYPGMEDRVEGKNEAAGPKWLEDKVVIDKGIITSRGPGTAGLFAAAIIGALLGAEEKEKIAKAVLMK